MAVAFIPLLWGHLRICVLVHGPLLFQLYADVRFSPDGLLLRKFPMFLHRSGFVLWFDGLHGCLEICFLDLF